MTDLPGKDDSPNKVASHSQRHLTLLFLSYLFSVILALLTLENLKLQSLVFSDDAYIVARYSSNFISTGKPFFNIEEPVLGFTSPLNFIATTLGVFSGATFESSAAFIALFNLFSASFLILGVGRVLEIPILLSTALAIIPFSGRFFLTGMIGLEPFISLHLVTLGLYLFLIRCYRASSLTFGLAALSRPEFIFFGTISLLCGKGLRTKSTLMFLLPLVIWMAASFSIFGTPIPNSFSAKNTKTDFNEYASHTIGITASESFVHNALRSVRDSKLLSESIGDEVFVLTLIVIFGVFYQRFRVPFLTLAGIPIFIMLSYCFIGPPPEQTWHLVTQRILLCLAASISVYLLLSFPVDRLIDSPKLRGAVHNIAAFPLALLLALHLHNRLNTHHALESYLESEYWFGARFETYRDIASYIRKNFSADKAVGIGEIGIVGFHVPNPIVDFHGIVHSSPCLHHKDYSKREQCLIRQYQPDVIVLHGPSKESIVSGGIQYHLNFHRPKSGYMEFGIYEKSSEQSDSHSDL